MRVLGNGWLVLTRLDSSSILDFCAWREISRNLGADGTPNFSFYLFPNTFFSITVNKVLIKTNYSRQKLIFLSSSPFRVYLNLICKHCAFIYKIYLQYSHVSPCSSLSLSPTLSYIPYAALAFLLLSFGTIFHSIKKKSFKKLNYIHHCCMYITTSDSQGNCKKYWRKYG